MSGTFHENTTREKKKLKSYKKIGEREANYGRKRRPI